MSEISIGNFEELGHQNGRMFWWAHELSEKLGYSDFLSFRKVISRAMNNARNIGVDEVLEFQSVLHSEGYEGSTYKLSRFAVMMCLMEADNKKEEVKQARAELAKITDELFREVERINNREQLKFNEKYMTSVAVDNGLSKDSIALFKDSGYRGLYNMGLKELKDYKGLKDSKKTLYDFMNPLELAANNLRAELTAEKIKSSNLSGDRKIIEAARSVGVDVRDIVIKNTGKRPEDIPIEKEDIGKVKSNIKRETKKINK